MSGQQVTLGRINSPLCSRLGSYSNFIETQEEVNHGQKRSVSDMDDVQPSQLDPSQLPSTKNPTKRSKQKREDDNLDPDLEDKGKTGT